MEDQKSNLIEDKKNNVMKHKIIEDYPESEEDADYGKDNSPKRFECCFTI